MTKLSPPISRWSFSTLKAFEACPYRVYLQKVAREPEPEPEPGKENPLERGNRIHLAAELFVRGEGPFIKELQKFAPQFRELKAIYSETPAKIELEQKWGFNREWERREWSDPDCWAMVRCDAVRHTAPRSVLVIDYKTGKSRGKEVPHRQQMQLYGIAALLRYPEAETVRTELWYLDEGKTASKTYSRGDITALIDRWEKRANNLTSAIIFSPKANRMNCRYCPYGTNVGTGACAYAVEE